MVFYHSDLFKRCLHNKWIGYHLSIQSVGVISIHLSTAVNTRSNPVKETRRSQLFNTVNKLLELKVQIVGLKIQTKFKRFDHCPK